MEVIIILIIIGVIYFSNKASKASKQRKAEEFEKKRKEEKAFAEELSKRCQQIIQQKYTKIEKTYSEGLAKWNQLYPESTKETIVSNIDKIIEYDRLAKLSFTISDRSQKCNVSKKTQERIDNVLSRQREEEQKRRQEEEAKRKVELAKYKSDRDAIVRTLQNNGIKYFYHFTARENLTSIKEYGGLYSWYNMQENKRSVPCSGGDDWSHQLDMRHGLQDYVRLSFCDDHPMAFRLMQKGTSLVLLKISIEVATWKDTLFSDINAADSSHRHGGSIEDLKRVNFNAVKRNYVSRDDVDFKPHQAEVMVKTFIPVRYILNLDSPISL